MIAGAARSTERAQGVAFPYPLPSLLPKQTGIDCIFLDNQQGTRLLPTSALVFVCVDHAEILNGMMT